jgi:hypothetical protein
MQCDRPLYGKDSITCLQCAGAVSGFSCFEEEPRIEVIAGWRRQGQQSLLQHAPRLPGDPRGSIIPGDMISRLLSDRVRMLSTSDGRNQSAASVLLIAGYVIGHLAAGRAESRVLFCPNGNSLCRVMYLKGKHLGSRGLGPSSSLVVVKSAHAGSLARPRALEINLHLCS